MKITSAIIAMAHGLNLRVVAEGVETREQLKFLHNEGCEAAQGYLLYRPLQESAVAGVLERNRLEFADREAGLLAQAG
jgi:EAL domain-containing protein (putative c-di-GMP-specific phosphodiesterase class I)